MKKISLEPEDEGLMCRLFVLSRHPAHMSRLLVVQQCLRPGALLEFKLSEELNLASSLEAGTPSSKIEASRHSTRPWHHSPAGILIGSSRLPEERGWGVDKIEKWGDGNGLPQWLGASE
jgi:hypothetical protein